jgi:lipopolysaccharide/colanic/teichoic acid biosynthesis glycosyltransferase
MGTEFGQQIFATKSPVPSPAMQSAPLTRTEMFAKRACDIVLALTALVLLAPLMLMTALVIKLNSLDPVIIRQRLTGFDGRAFSIYKFRTMSVLKDRTQAVQARRNDLRLTKVGRVLRQSNIDELPQLFNVLKGDLSLVGPKLHAGAHDEQYRALISSYAFRHHIKPGIVGWAQVNRDRGEIREVRDIEKCVELDVWYINNWSLLLDLRIMWRTCFQPNSVLSSSYDDVL